VARGVTRTEWPSIVARAAEIVESYDTPVTLRQLYYRLVSEQLIENKNTNYKRLSAVTAEARRAGNFPELSDRGRSIHRSLHFDSAEDAVDATLRWYRLDRTVGQDVSLYLAVEKAGLVTQLRSWFGGLGVPILALGGYSSQTYVDEIVDDVYRQPRPESPPIEEWPDGWPDHRPAVLLYAGDYDPSGEDIDRDFTERTGCWAEIVRVALNAEQVQEYGLPPNPGKATDSRAAAFVARHGELVQVEIDALPPETLRSLFQTAIAEFWEASPYDRVRTREQDDRAELRRVAAALRDGAS